MLTKIAISSCLAGLTLASFEQIIQALDQSGAAVERGIKGTSAYFGDYGCWCYFDENHGKGRGPAVDAYDALCKQLHHNYECLIMETAAGANDSCDVDPWAVEYTPDLGVLTAMFNNNYEGVLAACEAQPDPCKVNVCKTEMGFAVQFALENQQSSRDDAAYKHELGFQPLEGDNCPIKENKDTTDSEKSCCGPYPMRFPYKTFDGNRACCNVKTYDVNTLECCADGSGIKFIGTC